MLPKKHDWRTYSVERPTPDTVTVHFDTGGGSFQYLPGQFINLTVQVGDAVYRRSYSLSSAPGVDERPAITVKAVIGGVVSNHLVAHAETIKDWQVEGPFGNFTMPLEAERNNAPIVLIAGGSGITPLWSIAKSLLYGTEQRLFLVYASRNAASVIFGNELRAYEEMFTGRFRMVHVFSKPDTLLHGYSSAITGRLTAEVLNALLKENVGSTVRENQHFLCGPDGLMETVQQALHTIGVEDSQVFTERFQAASSVLPVEANAETFEVLLHASDHSSLVEVPPGVSILDAALSEHIPLRYSCKTGTCGLCVGKVLKGRVNMAFNGVLAPSEIREGRVLLCQCYPADDAVTIEADAEWTIFFEQ